MAGELWHFQYFLTWRHPLSWIWKVLVFGHMTVIVFLICCCIPNFIKIGSRVRPPSVAAVATASWLTCRGHTQWDATTQVSSKSVHWQAIYRISNIFQHGSRSPSLIKKKIIFGHMAVIVFLICCRVPIFIKIGSRVRPPDAHRLTTKCSVRGC